MRLAENTEEKRQAYEKALRRLLKRSDILDAEAIKSMQSLISDMRERISGRLANVLAQGDADNQWGLFWIPRLISAATEVVNEMADRAGETLGAHLRDSWQLGSEMTDKPLEAVTGLKILSPVIDQMTLTILSPFSAQLITRINETTREVVDKAIKTNVALGESPSLLMRELAKGPLDKGPWKTLTYRTEIITRTEVARVQTLASEARLQKAVLEFPNLTQGKNGLKQIFMSNQIGEWPCTICEPLDGKVYDMDDPQKPVPPMHPNCRCSLSPFFPGISTRKRAPRPISNRQRKASVTESHCCG